MSDILEKITSSNIIFFSIIGVLVLIIIIMIILIRKENKNKLNDILDQSKAIKVLDENEITDTVAIPNITLEETGVITIPSLDDNVNSDLNVVSNDVNMDVNTNINNGIEFNSGAIINDTITLPKIEEDEIIEPIVNPFEINVESDDFKTLEEIDNFTKEIELPSLKEDFALPVSDDFELPSLKDENVVDEVINDEVQNAFVPDLVVPEIEVPIVDDSFIQPIINEDDVISNDEVNTEIELPKIVNDLEDVPNVSDDKDLDVVLPVINDDVILPEVSLDTEEKERVKVDIQSMDFSPIEVELPKEEENSPVIKEEESLPFSFVKEDDDEDDGKYEYDEDIDEEDDGVYLSDLDDDVVTDDNLAELASKLEERPVPDVVKLTSYEEKQEEEAIISYDELLSKTDTISIEKNEREMENQAIDIRDINDDNYSYEEDFLSSLKDLRDSLR